MGALSAFSVAFFAVFAAFTASLHDLDAVSATIAAIAVAFFTVFLALSAAFFFAAVAVCDAGESILTAFLYGVVLFEAGRFFGVADDDVVLVFVFGALGGAYFDLVV